MRRENERMDEENLRQMLLQERRMNDMERDRMLREMAVRFGTEPPSRSFWLQVLSFALVFSLVGGLVMLAYLALGSAVYLSARLASRF